MSKTLRYWLVAILIVLSIGCAVGFAVCLGTLAHTAQRAVGTGGPAPSAFGYIATALSFLGMILGGRWAQWLASAAAVMPAVENAIGQIQQARKADSGPTTPVDVIQQVEADSGDLAELVAATKAWSANKSDKSLERRWAMACLTALKDVASFESPNIATAISTLGGAIVTECFGEVSADPGSIGMTLPKKTT